MLIHYLTILPEKELSKEQMDIILDDFMNVKDNNPTCTVDDELVQYIWKSLLWVDSYWSRGEVANGLPYYSESIIDVRNTKKLSDIFVLQKKLLELATPKILDIQNYDKENDMYVYKNYNRDELIKNLSEAIALLDSAVAMNKSVMYIGI